MYVTSVAAAGKKVDGGRVMFGKEAMQFETFLGKGKQCDRNLVNIIRVFYTKCSS